MLSRVYDRVSSTYDDDWNGIYRQSREINIAQILNHVCSINLASAVDIAVGTGNVFHDLSRHLSIERQIGIDISECMLGVACDKLSSGFVSICDDALNINNYVSKDSQDLVLCHFIFSHVDPNKILERAYRILKPGGLVSIASSTQEALADIHREFFPLAGKLLKIGANLKNSTTPKSHAALCEMVGNNGFDILEKHQSRDAVSFGSFADVVNWAIGSGWAAQYFKDHYWIKRIFGRAWFAVAVILYRPIFPVMAANDISLLLARRPN